jgi:hypothetical protein
MAEYERYAHQENKEKSRKMGKIEPESIMYIEIGNPEIVQVKDEMV